MHIFQNVMEKSKLYSTDEFGVKNYNYFYLGIMSVLLFSVLNICLGYITYVSESGVANSNINNYSDALWLMVMSSTTIGFGDVYPVTLMGRSMVFLMFVLGVGILGGVGAIFANKVFGFADTSIKNRELRKQNDSIIHQNIEIKQQLDAFEKKLEQLINQK